jgi:hypothetical protein
MPRCTADALRRTWANREQSQATLQGTAGCIRVGVAQLDVVAIDLQVRRRPRHSIGMQLCVAEATRVLVGEQPLNRSSREREAGLALSEYGRGEKREYRVRRDEPQVWTTTRNSIYIYIQGWVKVSTCCENGSQAYSCERALRHSRCKVAGFTIGSILRAARRDI